ncbi:MAG: hypothetical protein PHE55_01625 [Methylococcaceae bacterium]|nr:hypothetical protein [Methylococcaceae bacterium]
MRIADCGLRIADCGLRIADCGGVQVRISEFGFHSAICNPNSAILALPHSAIHLCFLAVLMDATVIASISLPSFINDSNCSAFTIPVSTNNSIQYTDSSDSSSTIPIFAMKSAVDLARQAAR